MHLSSSILTQQRASPYSAMHQIKDWVQSCFRRVSLELLAVVYDLERFHTYTYGREVTVESDHKPLEVIFKKLLHRAPKRLQRMIMRVQLLRGDRPGIWPLPKVGLIYPTMEARKSL